jgi:ABC-type bacteriocin/lantibiotic exporter with double-glycine peptidase domain
VLKKDISHIQDLIASKSVYFFILIFSITGTGIVEYTLPYIYQLVVDEVLVRRSLEQMPKFVFGYILLVTLLVGLATARSFARSTLSVHSTKHARNKLLKKLESYVINDIQQEANSEALQLSLNDTTEYRNYWAVVQDAFTGLIKAIIGFTLLVLQSIPLTIFVLVYSALALFIPWWLNKRVEKSSGSYFQTLGKVTQKLENLIVGIAQMLQMGVYKKQFLSYENTFEEAIQKAQKLSVWATLSGQSFVFFNFLLTPFSFMFLLPQLQAGTMSTGQAIAMTMFASSFMGSISTLVDTWSQRSQLSGAFTRIDSFIAQDTEKPTLPNPIFEPKIGLNAESLTESMRTSPKPVISC